MSPRSSSPASRKWRFIEAREQGGRSRVDGGATRLAERSLGEAAAEHADGRDAGLARSGSVVGRVADRDGIGAGDLQLLQHDLEDVRSRLGFFGIFGGS